MYRYDEYDQRIVRERAAQFRGQVERRLSGELTENEFKPLRLQNGLYLQLHAYMLRIAIPYGLLSSTQLRRLAHISRTYDRGYGHFTTRQNLQLNWPKLEDVPKILDELAEVEMHAIQTSGNCIRNITTDPMAGIARDEIEARYPGYLRARRYPPGYEHDDELLERIHNGLRDVIENVPGERLLVVAHGGIVYCIERSLGEPFRHMQNLGAVWLTITGDARIDLGARVDLLVDFEGPHTAPQQI